MEAYGEIERNLVWNSWDHQGLDKELGFQSRMNLWLDWIRGDIDYASLVPLF